MFHRWIVAGALLISFGCEDGRVSQTPDGGAATPDAALPACGTQLGDAFPFDMTASTADAADVYGGASCGSGGDGAPDVAFQWTAPHAGRFAFSTRGSTFDTLLYVRRGSCGGVEVACNDDAQLGGRSSLAVAELAANETVAIIVDGYASTEQGDVRLTVSERESACDDGVDNDADGLSDCDDADDCPLRECLDEGDWPEAWTDFEWRVLELTNERRAAGANCGGEIFGPAGPLDMDEVIRVAARGHSEDMGAQNYFEHDSLDGRTFDQRMSMAGFDGPSPWGENIAAGQRSPEDVVQGWMESPGHCRNIMNPDFHVIGIGYAENESSTFGTYWTQDFAGGH